MMKKFFYLSVLAVLFASCSTDGENEVFQENAVVMSTVNPSTKRMAETTTIECLSSLEGTTYVDVSGGLNNPQVVFIADVINSSNNIRTRYTLSLEVQVLADCEDLNSGTGAITRFSLYNVSMPGYSDPSIKLYPSQLPASCYRWRYVVEGTKTINGVASPCVTATPWYEQPLF